MRWRIGFVVPRYGTEILGGAETAVRRLAEEIVAADLAEVQVLTTCAVDYFTWRNDLPAGETIINGVPVQRFRVDQKYRDVARSNSLHMRLFRGEKLTVDEQYEWIHQSVHHSPEMYLHLESQGTSFNFLIFVPYLFGTTHYGSAIYPERSVLWPCLHDEVYAYARPMSDLYRTCRGVMFNTDAELHLAERIYGQHPRAQVVGIGVAPIQANADRFRASHSVQSPFILYAGRLEQAKNVPLLIRYFLDYKRNRGGEVKLVLMGWGPEDLGTYPDVVNLGLRPEQEKLDAIAAATLLCQPSINESFSIVLMESWLCGVPVLVHENCPVTRHHVVKSNGGLYFHDYAEFESILDLMLSDREFCERLGDNGRSYAQREFNWDAVLKRFDIALEKWSALKSE